jgi:hypothetical protein
MKKLFVILAVFALIGTASAADEPFGQTGFSDNTTIIEAPGPDEEGSYILQNWDGSAENGYCWQFAGVVEPDYGAWAECYISTFVVIQQWHHYFTQTGYYIGQQADFYLWDDAGGIPGNVIQVVRTAPGPIPFWPEVGAIKIPLDPPIKVEVPVWYVGFWPVWPGESCGWFVAADEDGFPGCRLTKIAPGIGYPTGWQDCTIVGTFAGCQSLGLGAWVKDQPTPSQGSTWGQIKALF